MLAVSIAAVQGASNADEAQAIAQTIAQVRQGGEGDYSRLCNMDHELLVATAAQLSTDTLPALRRMAVELASCALKQQKKSSTGQAVELLCLLCADTLWGIGEDAAEALTACRRDDFSEKAKNSLVASLRSTAYASGTAMRLIGYLHMESAKDRLQELSITRSLGERRWDAMLALARIGEPVALNSCMNKIRRVGVGDNLVYHVMPDLVYLHRPEAVAYMVEVLNSNEKLCSSPNPDNEEKILCGYRVMERMVGLVKGFPLKLQPSGDIDTDDYTKALNKARSWCNSQDGKFTIIDENY